jgi:ribosome-associated protein
MASSDLYVCPRLTIPADQLTITLSRSSGPGGQNVNKVNSKVTLRWEHAVLGSLDVDWHRRFLSRFGNRMTVDGEIVIQSDQYRDQPRNLASARGRLVEMLLACENPPVKRKASIPSRASRERRLEGKRHISIKKTGRRSPQRDDI